MSSILVILGWKPSPTEIEERPNLPYFLSWFRGHKIPAFEQVFIIGENFSNVDCGVSDWVDGTIIPVHPGNLFYHTLPGENGEGIPGNPYGLSRDRLTSFQKNIQFLKGTTTPVYYACLDKAIARDIFELAALVKTSTLSNRYWFAGGDKFSEIPDVFNGTDRLIVAKHGLSEKDATSFKDLITLGINHVRMFIACGYHVNKNIIPSDGWALQSAGTWLSLIISMNQLIPRMIDSDVQRDLYENSQMRKAVTENSVLTLANYFSYVPIINNGNPILNSENYGGDWYSKELWDRVWREYTSDKELL